jgi:hypothetical protein
MGMFKGKMPDITAAQVIAALTWVAAQAVAAGWVNNDQAQHWLQVGSTIVASVWLLGDVLLRGARNIRVASEAKAGITPTPDMPAPKVGISTRER